MDRAKPAPNIVRDYVVELGSEALDLERLRRAFGELMDAAARDVQCAGYEQDDSLIERFVDLRHRGEKQCVTIPVESLTDTARLLAPFHAEHARRFGLSLKDRAVEMVSARARCSVYGKPNRPA
jgi:N-methylhydantoinase A/oxoprolinase/acetone carboxylase beta subunit